MALSENSTALPLVTIVKFPGKKVQQVGLGRSGMAELQPLMPMDLATFVRTVYPFELSAWQWRMLEKLAATRGPESDPPLIVRATPEQRRALLDCRPIRPDCRCEACGWEGDAKALRLVKIAGAPDDVACPMCACRRIVDLEYEDDEQMGLQWTPDEIAQMQLEHAATGQPPLEINRIVELVASARRKPEAAVGSLVRAAMNGFPDGKIPPMVASPSAVIGTFRTPPAQGLYRAPSRSLECTRCKWRGREFELTVHPRDPDLNSCPQCGMASWLQMDGKKYVPPALLAPAPVAACTAHVTAAAAKTPEIRCTSCGWEGEVEDLPYRNPQDAESQMCPLCSRNASHCMETPDDSAAAPSPIDQAIRGSASLDPGGDRKPAEQLLVETFDQAEARRKVDAERIANIMKGGGL